MKQNLTLISRMSRIWNDLKPKLPALPISRSSIRTLISASIYLLLLFAMCEELWRVKGSYYGVFRRLVFKPASLLEDRRVSGCGFEQDPPGSNDLLDYISRRILDSGKALFLPLGTDDPESQAAYCILTYGMFPRPVIRIYPSQELQGDYLASIAESNQARYLILYRANKNYNPPFAHCRFGPDLILVDVKNEISCSRDVN
jgi:hypothetical protein